MSVTPAQIRSARKQALRSVKIPLRELDSMLEKLQRRIERILKITKRLPDSEDAMDILQQLRAMDSQLDKVVSQASSFSQYVR